MQPFSIIIPIYNAECYLSECIESIKNQTVENFECILVDDGSTDASSEICQNAVMEDNRFKYICAQNGGPSSARNLGLEAACGRYVCFVDADDFVDDTFLEVYNETILRHNPDMVYCGIKFYPSNDEKKCLFPTDRVFSGIELLSAYPTVYSDKSIPFSVRYCFKKEFLDKNQLRFNVKSRFGEDSSFNFSAWLKAQSIVCKKEITYYYRFNPSSATSQRYKPTMIDDLISYHEVKRLFVADTSESTYRYWVDMSLINVTQWIPACIDNLKNSETGFRYLEAKKLLNANFVQDSVRFLLKNNLATRKLQWLYYFLIKIKSPLIHLVWKNQNLDKFVS